MILLVLALYDAKTGAYGVPFFMSHIGQAVRACVDLASDLNTTVGRHPHDFTLMEIGSYDDTTGTMSARAPVSHGVVGSYLRPQPSLPLEG